MNPHFFTLQCQVFSSPPTPQPSSLLSGKSYSRPWSLLHYSLSCGLPGVHLQGHHSLLHESHNRVIQSLHSSTAHCSSYNENLGHLAVASWLSLQSCVPSSQLPRKTLAWSSYHAQLIPMSQPPTTLLPPDVRFRSQGLEKPHSPLLLRSHCLPQVVYIPLSHILL